jgi:acetyl-CoA/propionyl-CoA carboxylase biotin carboxyl carrier protein
MKMEHRLVAPISGRVQVRVVPGDLVKLDQLVATVEAHPDPEEDVPPTTVGRPAATPTRSTVA